MIGTKSIQTRSTVIVKVRKATEETTTSYVSWLAHSFQKYLEVVLIDLDDTCVKRAMPRAGVTPFFRVEKRQTELTIGKEYQ